MPPIVEENWTDPQVQMLISMWKEPKISEAISKPKPVYVLLASRLNDVWGNIDCHERCIWNPHMVKDKIRSLRQRYLKIFEELKEKQPGDETTGTNNSTWPYYDDLCDIHNAKHKTTPPTGVYSPPSSDEDNEADLGSRNNGVNSEKHAENVEHREEAMEQDVSGRTSESKGEDKGDQWTDEETGALVEIWQESNVASAIALPINMSKTHVYRDIAGRLNSISRSGRLFNSVQVKDKIQSLKMLYNKVSTKVQSGPEGSFDPTGEMLFYKEVGEILSRKLPDSVIEVANQARKAATAVRLYSSSSDQRPMSWRNKEVRMLLSIWKEPVIAEKVASKNKQVYQFIADRLNDIWGMMGRHINAKQVKQKILILKRIYYKQRESGNAEINWPFYGDVDEILSRAPESPTESDIYDDGSDVDEKSSSFRRNRNRSKNWNYKEVELLIKIWKDPNIAYRVAQQSTRMKRVWNVMTTKFNQVMDKNMRTVDQIRFKVKDLKYTFRNVDARVKTGKEEAAKLWPYYQDMKEILSQDFSHMKVTDAVLEEEEDDAAPKAKKERTERTRWSDQSIQTLISIWQEPDICARVAEVTTRHKTVYGDMADQLNMLIGTSHSERQVREKTKEMRNTFRKVKAKMGQGTAEVNDLEDEPWPYFGAMEKILNREENFATQGKVSRQNCEEDLMRGISKRARSNNWNEEETQALISILKDPEVNSLVLEVTTKLKPIYGVITKVVCAMSGVERTETQVRNRTKDLVGKYKYIVNKMSDEESSSSVILPIAKNRVFDVSLGQQWEYYDDLKDIMTREGPKRYNEPQIGEDEQARILNRLMTEHKEAIDKRKLSGKIDPFQYLGARSKPRSIWTHAETQRLLTAWKRPDISRRVALVTTKAKDVYLEIADYFNDSSDISTPRTPYQIRNKIKVMKDMYEKVAAKMGEGEDQSAEVSIDPSSVWCFYEDVHDIITRDKGSSGVINEEDNETFGEEDDDEDVDWMPNVKKEYQDASSSSKKGKRNRITTWSGKQIQTLLTVWKQTKIMNAVISKEPGIYQTIAEKINQMLPGTDHIPRDSFQVKLKMNTLKRRYKTIAADIQGTQPDSSPMWPYYKDMQDIMHQLPSSPNSTDMVDVFFGSGNNVSASEFSKSLDSSRTSTPKKRGYGDRTLQNISKKARMPWQRTRAVNWNEEETKALLAIWKEPKIWRLVAEPKTAKKSVWQVMATRLNKQDLTRSVQDMHRTAQGVKEKVRTMKRQYRLLLQEAEEMGETSFDELADKWEHYKDMHEIMTREPDDDELDGEDGDEVDSIQSEIEKSQPAKRRGRCAWPEEVVKILISLWKEPYISIQIAKISTRNKNVYAEMADRLNAILETEYTEMQIKHKTKELRNQYMSKKQNADKKWSHYDDMHEILSRPEYRFRGYSDAGNGSQGDADTATNIVAPAKKKTPSTSTTWSDDDTKALISVWKQPENVHQHPTRDITFYDSIAFQLRPQYRDAYEVKRKMILMEKVYKKLLYYPSGGSKKWQFFDDMKEMFSKPKSSSVSSTRSSLERKTPVASTSQTSESDTVEIFFKNGNFNIKSEFIEPESSFENASEEEDYGGGKGTGKGKTKGKGTPNTPRQRSQNWDDKETKRLLRLWKEPNILKAIAKPSTKYKKVYKDVADLLNTHPRNTNRDAYQIRMKFASLKKYHRTMQERAAKSGEDPSKLWAFFSDVNEIVNTKLEDLKSIKYTPPNIEEESEEEEEEEDEERDDDEDEDYQGTSNTPRRRSHWDDRETRRLLRLWKEPNILRAVARPSTKHKKVYSEVAELLNKHPRRTIKRNGSQLRMKFSTLKKSHKTITERAAKSGEDPSKLWNFFSEVNEILNTKLEDLKPKKYTPPNIEEESEEEEEEEDDDDYQAQKQGSYGQIKRWSERDIRSLIDIWREPVIAMQISNESGSIAKSVYKKVTKRLQKDYRVHRVRNQVAKKIRDLKRIYYVLADGGQYGSSTSDTWPYFEAMGEILSGEGLASLREAADVSYEEESSESSEEEIDYRQKNSNNRYKKWTEKETWALLSMWKEPNIMTQIASKPNRKASGGTVKKTVFGELVKRLLTEHQVKKTRVQLCDKIRIMRRTYNLLLPEGGLWGNTTKATWKYYNAMHEIMSMPMGDEEGQASSEQQDLEKTAPKLGEGSVAESAVQDESVPESVEMTCEDVDTADDC